MEPNEQRADRVYRFMPGIVREDFPEGTCLLCLSDRRLVEVDLAGRAVLDRVDGIRTVRDIWQELSTECDARLADVVDQIQGFEKNEIISLVDPDHSRKDKKKMPPTYQSSACYLRNPDVVLREEDVDGALLFNPDTSQVKILNVTGLFIWRLCDGKNDTPAIIAGLQKEFEDAPADALEGDVKAFLEEMLLAGFVGTLEEA